MRTIMVVHADGSTRAAATYQCPVGFRAVDAADLDDAAGFHARTPVDLVVTSLEEGLGVVRRLRAWYPEPAVVTIGSEDERLSAIRAGAHGHLTTDRDGVGTGSVIAEAWLRHRAARTRHAIGRPTASADDVHAHVGRLVSLLAAAQDLFEVEEAPHGAVRGLLDQAAELGQETLQLAASDDEPRARLDLDALLDDAWGARIQRDTTLTRDLPDDLSLHGWPSLVRTALVVLLAHTLRGDARRASNVHVDTEELDDALRLRVHDDGPPVPPGIRRGLFVGDGDDAPRLLVVRQVAALHGGAAWLADGDRDGGAPTMAVLELPMRARRRRKTRQ